MTEPSHWQQCNQHYLATAVDWIKQKLRCLSACEDSEGAQTLGDLSRQLCELEELPDPPALVVLAMQFGLTRFEQELLLLCAAMEFDTGIPRACAEAQGDPDRAYPTFSLAMSALDQPVWDSMSPDRPLRYWQMVEMSSGVSPLIGRHLRADERIVNYLKGLNHLDGRLLPYLKRIDEVAEPHDLPESHGRVAEALERRIRRSMQTASTGASVIVQLTGSDGPGKREIVSYLVRRFGLQQYDLGTNMLPTQASEIDQLSRLWRREALLTPVCLGVAEMDRLADPGPSKHIQQFIKVAGSLVFVEVAENCPFGEHALTCQVDKPTKSEQIRIWDDTVGDLVSSEVVGRLSTQFHLSSQTIRSIAEPLESVDGSPTTDIETRLWNESRTATRPKLDGLTHRIDVKAKWDDIVLPEAETNLLRQIAAQVRHRARVYDSWGFRQRMNRGLGISALFAGPSGTGKTMAAEVLANELQLDLYRIDLSAVVNKYIGETEKNLRRVFDAVDDGGAILFFDEADALFGTRTSVKDSHDRYANIEVNYLLQRMESYRGLAILATNMKGALDQAFLRRLRFIVDMPTPGAKERKRIWQRAFPPETPTVGLDYAYLARLQLTGGNIHSIALNAAFQSAASENANAISMSTVLSAVEIEFRKLQKPIPHLELPESNGRQVVCR